MTKFVLDMVGGQANKSQWESLEKAAETIHAQNLCKHERIAEELRDADHSEMTRRQTEQFLKDKRSEAVAIKSAPKPTLDEIAVKQEERAAKQKKEAERKEKALVEVKEIAAAMTASAPQQQANQYNQERQQQYEYEYQRQRDLRQINYGRMMNNDLRSPWDRPADYRR